MPYTVRKQKCKQSSGKKGSYVLSYTDKKGKKHRACHTSEKGARGQIAAIEAEGIQENGTMMKITISELRRLISEAIESLSDQRSGMSDYQKIKDEVFSLEGGEDYEEFMDKLDDLLYRNDVILGQLEKEEDQETKEELEQALLHPELIQKIKKALVDIPKGFVARGIFTGRQSLDFELQYAKFHVLEIISDFYKEEEPEAARDNIEAKEQLRLLDKMEHEEKLANPSTLRQLESLIRFYVIKEVKKKKSSRKKDVDGDGDIDSADYKANVYMSGGVPKKKAIKMASKYNQK